ncbi:MAG: methionine--tRNA ligase [Anaerolineae bacterium]|jgi:methionyl-tRNA synthetase|nr:MAG: methionine--tRNA ligase [Anaerolineae bacterium]
MTQNILVAVAWPYANSEIHVGNLTGSYLPADIFARFQRLKGNRVAMVSGSDSHGTPVTVRADAEGITPYQVYQRYHQGFIELFLKAGLTYDLFTSTHTTNHFKVSQAIFLALNQNGYLYTQSEQQWFSPTQNRFLPDRYVEGTCYLCGYEGARGDQCDGCGSLLDATQLINPRSKIDGSTPELRQTAHFYLDLARLQPEIVRFLEERQSYWRPNVLRQSLGQIQAENLRGRPITRDLDWGIPVPMEGWEGKCLYVWFEAVIGYLSATIEWAQIQGQADAWQDWWFNPEARAYYFIGKDNIPFHAIIWPGQLIGSGEWFGKLFANLEGKRLTLPYDVPANEFMNLEGKKISGSRNWAVWGNDFLSRYDPDPLRYYLTANMPETRDTDWDWQDFYQRNNGELVATWGNLANRVLSFAFKHWEGHVPEAGELRAVDQELLEKVRQGFQTVSEHLEAVHLRAALLETMNLASEVNKYLDVTGPWFEIKTNKEAAAKSIFTALRAIDTLKVLFAPFLPFSTEKLHRFFGYERPFFGEQKTELLTDELGEHRVLLYDGSQASGTWKISDLPPGQALMQPAPLFKKLDETIVAEERARLGA